MSNVYKHKNCLMLNLWNCNWDNKLPEIDGHATVIFNIITTEFRIWLRPKCIKEVWTKLTEITNYPEHVRQYVIKCVYKRLQENCSEFNVTGAWPIANISNINNMNFINRNYMGNYETNIATLPNQFELRYKVDKPYFPPFKRRPDFITISRP